MRPRAAGAAVPPRPRPPQDAANNEATGGGRCRPKANFNDDKKGVDDNEATGGGRRRPNTSTTVAHAAKGDDDE